jgi:hypothetical protein
LTQLDPDIAELISEHPCIVGFRNRIIHGYDTVDDAAVWGIAESHLPRLLDEAKNLFDRYPWHLLSPVALHPDYQQEVLKAVKARGGNKCARRWEVQAALTIQQ